MKELVTNDAVTGIVTERFGTIDCKLMVRFYEPKINERKQTVRNTCEFFVLVKEDVEDPITQEISSIDSPYSIRKKTTNYLLNELDTENLIDSIASVVLYNSYGLSFEDWK